MFYVLNNINMKEIKNYLKYLKKCNLSILSSSLTFYIIIIFIPLISIVQTILDYLNVIKVDNILEDQSVVSSILLIFSIIFILHKFTSNISEYSNIIYQEEVKKKEKIKRSVVFVFILIILIVALFVFSFYLDYILMKLMVAKRFLINIVKSIYMLFAVTLVNGIVYKYIIPIKVKFKNTFLVSLLVSIIWYILIFLYEKGILKFENYNIIYYSFSNIIILIWFIYFLSYSFLLGIVINYYLDYKNNKLNVGNNKIEQ